MENISTEETPENIKKILQSFNDHYNKYGDYEIRSEFDGRYNQFIINVEKTNVENLYLGVDIFYSEFKKKFTVKYVSYDELDCLRPLTGKISSSSKGEFSYKEAATILYNLIEEQILITKNILRSVDCNCKKNHTKNLFRSIDPKKFTK